MPSSVQETKLWSGNATLQKKKKEAAKKWWRPFKRDARASTATVWMASPSSAEGKKSRMTTVNQETLRYLELFFGSFCIFLLGLAIFDYFLGLVTIRTPIIIFFFVVINLFFYYFALRPSKSLTLEFLQPIIGAIICPFAYLMVDGILHPWWPGYAMMCLSGVITLQLTTGTPFWGRLLLFFYLINFTLTNWLGLEQPHWHELFLRVGVIGIVGLMLVQIMEILAQSLTKVYERSLSLRKAKEELQELDSLKTDFFANVSHETRTPITLTLGPLEGILKGRFGELSDPIRNQLKIMERNQKRLLGSINQILDIAKAEAGAAKLNASKMKDVNRFITERIEQFRPLAEERGLQLKTSLDPVLSGMELYLDREKFDKIIFNLVSNALKFTLKGSVEVITEIEGDNFVLSVSDTGLGIKEEEIPHVFDRFRQAEGSVSKKYKGTGLGLALVQEFSKLHGGEVSVQSTYGKGTTFQVKIPLGKEHLDPSQILEISEEELKEEVPSLLGKSEILQETESPVFVEEVNLEAEASFDSEKPTVLYVDDNADLRYYVRDLLRDTYNVFLGADGKEGLVLAEKHHPDLVLTDVKMPKMTGDQLCQKIKENPLLQSTPVVLLTAQSLLESKLEGLKKGADDYLTKPFSETELLARVKNLVIMRQQQMHLKKELMASRKIQFSLLPPPTQKFEDLSLELLYHPSEELSGDFCDILPRDEWIYFYVADVTSHGTASAQVTYLLKEIFNQATLPENSDEAPELPKVLVKVGKQYATHQLKYDVGIQLGRFHLKKFHLEYVRGNAPPALWVRKGGETKILNPRPGPFITANPSSALGENSFPVAKQNLERGESLFFFTDGCFEIPVEERPLGLKRFTNLLNTIDGGDWREKTLEKLREAYGHDSFPDDITILRLGL